MEKELFIGSCLICGQGMLEIVRVKNEPKFTILCDECMAEWNNPEDALKNRNGFHDFSCLVISATRSEVEELGWDKYLLPERNE